MANPVSIIGKDSMVNGDLSGDEDLVVEGRVEGSITITKHLVVEQGGIVQATVEAENVTIHGTIEGEINATQSATISAGATVLGDLTTPRITVEDGARLKGRVVMDVQLDRDLD